MQFDSLSSFLAMGGYGLYVWLSFGSCLFILLGILISSLHDTKKIKKEILAQIQREIRIKKAQQEGMHES